VFQTAGSKEAPKSLAGCREEPGISEREVKFAQYSVLGDREAVDVLGDRKTVAVHGNCKAFDAIVDDWIIPPERHPVRCTIPP
jgi:hypothetical protein